MSSIADASAEEWTALGRPDGADPSGQVGMVAGAVSASATAVLLVGRSIDVHLDLVARRLALRGCRVERFDADRARGPGAWSAQRARVEGGTFVAALRRSTDTRQRIAVHGHRSFIDPEPWPTVDARMQDFATQQLEHAIDGLLERCGVDRWINPPWVSARAEVKGRQLRIAVENGLAVPQTAVTDDAAEVRDLLDACGGEVVYKGLADPFVWAEDGRAGFLHTTLLTPAIVSDLDALLAYPGLFQERIRAVREHRVTVVGSDAFVATLDVDPNEAGVDWRRERDGAGWRRGQLDPLVVDAVVATVRDLGLGFGAVDLVESDEGIRFLEVNPDGAYSWLEHRLALPITARLCDLLVGS